MATREYDGLGITVHWDSDRCMHSERCANGLPGVFDRSARPWVQLDEARADAVAAVIDTCPSGALTYTRTDGAPNGPRGRAADDDPAPSLAVDPAWTADHDGDGVSVAIRPVTDGPYSITGPVAIELPNGTTRTMRQVSLCRCGNSGAKPFCDGSHARVGFNAPGVI